MRRSTLSLILVLLAPTAARAGDGLPASTATRVLDGQTFTYGVSNGALLAGTRAIVWGSDGGPLLPSGVRSSFYDTIDVLYHSGSGSLPSCFQPLGTTPSLSCLQANYPQCVVYGVDKKTPAYEFGGPSVPFDITNPTCRALYLPYIQAMAPSYDFEALDNISTLNNEASPYRSGVCSVVPDPSTGCPGPDWTQLYTGTADPQYARDVATWIGIIAATLHPGTLILGNTGGTPAANLASADCSATPAAVACYLAAGLDMIYDEVSWWNGCAPAWSAADWATRVAFYWNSGSPLSWVDNSNLTDLVNGGSSCTGRAQVTQQELDFALASDLLTKGNHTYWASNAFVEYGSYETYPGPWRSLSHGAADGPYSVSGGVYSRSFGTGQVLAIVNTNTAAATYALGATVYHTAFTNVRKTGTITLPPYPASGGAPPGALVLEVGEPAGVVVAKCTGGGC